MMYPAMHQGADSGHVILTIPGVSACLRCCLGLKSAGDIHTLHGEPGLGVDIKSLANLCVSLALEIIYSKATGRHIERWDLGKNIFYLANKRGPLSPDGPAVVLEAAQKRPGCQVCSAETGKQLLKG